MMAVLNSCIGDVHNEFTAEETAAKEAEQERLEAIDRGMYETEFNVPSECERCGGSLVIPSRGDVEFRGWSTINGVDVCNACEPEAEREYQDALHAEDIAPEMDVERAIEERF